MMGHVDVVRSLECILRHWGSTEVQVLLLLDKEKTET